MNLGEAKNLRVLFLIASCEVKSYGGGYPLGVMSLTSAIRCKNFLSKIASYLCKIDASIDSLPNVDVQLIDMNLVSKEFDVGGAISRFKPHIAGVSSDSTSIENAIELAKICSDVCPKTLRVIGGIHATVYPKDVLKKSLFEVAFLGDAVESFAHLVVEKSMSNSFDISKISGIYYKGEDGLIYSTGFRSPIVDLDDYPSVINSYDIADQYGNRGPGSIFSTLGCPYKCAYCARGVMRKGIRYRDPKKVVLDMIELRKKGFKYQYIHDDTFAYDKYRTNLFLNELEMAPIRDIGWAVQTRVVSLLKDNTADVALIRRMKKLGCLSVELGIETLDPVLSKELKGHTNLDVYRVTEALNITGIEVHYNLMVGLPKQTWASVARSLWNLFVWDTSSEILIDNFSVLFCVPYPGSLIHKNKSVRLKGTGENYPPFQVPELIEIAKECTLHYGYEVPTAVPTETDVMTSDEISEAYFYYLIYGYCAPNEIEDPIMNVIWREFATRMMIDNIANAEDSPKDRTRNQIIRTLRKLMLKGNNDFPIEDPGNLLYMIDSFSFQNGYRYLCCLTHDEMNKFLATLYIIWFASGGIFKKVRFLLWPDFDCQSLRFFLEKYPSPLEIMKSNHVEKNGAIANDSWYKSNIVEFITGKSRIRLAGLEFGYNPVTKEILIFPGKDL